VLSTLQFALAQSAYLRRLHHSRNIAGYLIIPAPLTGAALPSSAEESVE